MLTRWLGFAVSVVGLCAADLTSLSDTRRFDPSGAILEPDRTEGAAPARSVDLVAARGGYVSFQLAARVLAEYRLEIDLFPRASGLELEAYREWFHYVPADKRSYPDALIPVQLPYRGNRVVNQTVQPFWIDVWVPATAPPGTYDTVARLDTATVPIRVKVVPAVIPDDDVVIMDHNSYGTSWLATQYPDSIRKTGYIDLIHAYHRIFYEHRGIYHQLGYGHAGKVGPEFAPVLMGTGKDRHVSDWTAYDSHYGPLFDGSAFARTRRGPRPIPFVYLPINPEWPASFLWWGEPGYEREFVNVVSEMDNHFRGKGWTSTRFELFFNHKKRYKGFPWDGDEARFPRDYAYMKEYARLMKLAVPADSPAKWVFRADVSWTMERQFRELAGILNFWVCGGGMFSWYRDAARAVLDRGDIVWIYGGTPPVTEPASHITTDLLRTWLMGVGGFVRWQTVEPGPDPWFHLTGGSETLVYPGDRFGIAAPLPSIRLKLERNALQDLALLNAARARIPIDRLRDQAAQRFNGTTVDEWWTPRPPLADTNPEDWSNATVEDAMPRSPKFANIEPGAWDRVRAYVLETVAKEAH